MKTKWYTEFQCIECRHVLSEKEKHLSRGVCPYCGASNGSTIVECTTEVYRYEFDHPWWMFWKPVNKVYK